MVKFIAGELFLDSFPTNWYIPFVKAWFDYSESKIGYKTSEQVNYTNEATIIVAYPCTIGIYSFALVTHIVNFIRKSHLLSGV